MKNGKRIFHALLFVSVVAILSPWSALSAVTKPTDDAPLDLIIPPIERKIIDRRKTKTIEAHFQKTGKVLENVTVDLSHFMGSTVVDLRERDTPVKKQFSADGYGTCTSFGLAAAMENALGGNIELSERHLWSQYRRPKSSLALQTIASGRGVIEETSWPQEQVTSDSNFDKDEHYKVFNYRPLEDDIKSMLNALDQGSPIYFAMNTPVQMSALKKYINSTAGSKTGGHAVAVVGYQLDTRAPGGGYLIIKNSWGLTKDKAPVGELGYQWLNFAYCAKKGNYCRAWSLDRVENTSDIGLN